MKRYRMTCVSTVFLVTFLLARASSGLGQSKPAKAYVAHAAATLTDVPYYVAREKRFYRDEGLEATSLFVQGGALSAQVLVSGSVDFSLALGSGTRAALVGAPVKGIFVFNDKPYFFLYGRPGIKKAEDLRGKRIAVTGIGSSTDFAARAVLQHFGMNPDKDVNILATGGGTNVWSAVQSGAVDAAILWPPYDITARELGMNKILYLGDILTLPGGGVVAPESLLQEQREKVKRFLRATLKGLRFFLEDKNRRENTLIMMKVFGLSERDALSTYNFLRTIQTEDGLVTDKTVGNALDIALPRIRDARILSLSRQEQIHRMYDFSLLAEILKEQKIAH